MQARPSEAYPRRALSRVVWRSRWPVYSGDVVGLFVGGDDSGTMAGGVVIQEDEVFRWVSFLEGYDDVTQNFIPVLGGVHVAFNDPQGDFVVVSEACPHHDGSATL